MKHGLRREKFAICYMYNLISAFVIRSLTFLNMLHAKLQHFKVRYVLRGHSKRRPKIGFQNRLSLNAGQKYCRMLHESILQYFRPSFGFKTFVLSIFEWPLKTGFTVISRFFVDVGILTGTATLTISIFYQKELFRP